jgi:hypothetical protein
LSWHCCRGCGRYGGGNWERTEEGEYKHQCHCPNH